MDKAERELLKSDPFKDSVGNTWDFLETHRKQTLLVLGVGIGFIALGFLGWWYRANQHTQRQEALRDAMKIQEAQVGAGSNPYFLIYPTADEKTKAAQKAFGDVATKYNGTDEGAIAEYYLGVDAAANGRLDQAEKRLKIAVDEASTDYSSQAKLSLAQLYETQGKTADAERLLRELLAKPTAMVSKEQATVSLAHLISKKNPEEARRLLEPLRTERSAVSRVALTMLSELPRK